MSEKEIVSNETVEPIFEKKNKNQYERKVFKTSISDLVKQISKTIPENRNEVAKEDVDELMSEEEKKDIAIGLEQLSGVDQKTELINQADPRNDINYFKVGYKNWVNDNSQTYYDSASIGSKISYWIGSTLVANLTDKGKPDYIFYQPKDRLTVFKSHFNPNTIMMNDKYILYTNRYILELRDVLQNRIAFWFLIFGLVFGGLNWSIKTIHNGYNYVSSKITANGDKETFKKQQLENLKADAIVLIEKYKEHQITDSQFLEQKKQLKERELEINKQ